MHTTFVLYNIKPLPLNTMADVPFSPRLVGGLVITVLMLSTHVDAAVNPLELPLIRL